MHAVPSSGDRVHVLVTVPASAQLDTKGNPRPHARNLSIQLLCKTKSHTLGLQLRGVWEEVPKTVVHEDALAVLVVLTDSLARNTEPGVYLSLKGRKGRPFFQLVVCPPQQFLAWAPRRKGASYVNV